MNRRASAVQTRQPLFRRREIGPVLACVTRSIHPLPGLAQSATDAWLRVQNSPAWDGRPARGRCIRRHWAKQPAQFLQYLSREPGLQMRDTRATLRVLLVSEPHPAECSETEIQFE